MIGKNVVRKYTVIVMYWNVPCSQSLVCRRRPLLQSWLWSCWSGDSKLGSAARQECLVMIAARHRWWSFGTVVVGDSVSGAGTGTG